MQQDRTESCPVCGVKILKMVGGDKALFSVGPPATRSTLWTRVCQYAQKPGCINKNYNAIGEIKSTNDYYKTDI